MQEKIFNIPAHLFGDVVLDCEHSLRLLLVGNLYLLNNDSLLGALC